MADNGLSRATEIRKVDLEAIGDGDLVAVIVRDDAAREGFRVVGYCEGRAVPADVGSARAGQPLGVPCVCGRSELVYTAYSHRMPHVHRWPTLIYACPACGANVSFLRLTAEDARRALQVGLGVAPDRSD